MRRYLVYNTFNCPLQLNICLLIEEFVKRVKPTKNDERKVRKREERASVFAKVMLLCLQGEAREQLKHAHTLIDRENFVRHKKESVHMRQSSFLYPFCENFVRLVTSY